MRVEKPAVVNVPVLTLQDPLAAMGAVVLDCRPPLLPVSMDISGVDLSAIRFPAMSAPVDGLLPGRKHLSTGGDLLGLICPELGVAPLVDPGMDLEDEWPTPVGSPMPAVDEGMPLSPTSGVDVEVVQALLEVGVLLAMVTPIVDPAVGFPLSPATNTVPPLPVMSVRDSLSPEVAPPVGLAMGSPARSEILLHLVSPPASVASPGLPPSSSASRPAPDDGPSSSLAAAEQEFPWSTSLPLELFVESNVLPAPLKLIRMVGGGGGVVVPGSVVSSPAGDTEVAGGHQGLPDLSLECPFDVHQDRPVSGASPRVLDSMRGSQYRMTSYDQDSDGPDFSPAHGVQFHDPRLLEYVGAPESAAPLGL